MSSVILRWRIQRQIQIQIQRQRRPNICYIFEKQWVSKDIKYDQTRPILYQVTNININTTLLVIIITSSPQLWHHHHHQQIWVNFPCAEFCSSFRKRFCVNFFFGKLLLTFLYKLWLQLMMKIADSASAEYCSTFTFPSVCAQAWHEHLCQYIYRFWALIPIYMFSWPDQTRPLRRWLRRR